MSDVRLTATNPVDSSVVPVACNEKGELKLEEPLINSDEFVAKAGDTMTGNLHLGDGITLNPDGSAQFAGGNLDVYNTGKVIYGADKITLDGTNGSANFAGGDVNIDSSSRLLVGTSTARSNLFNSTVSNNLFQVEKASDSAGISIVTNNATNATAYLALCRSKGTSIGSNTLVASGDVLGTITFQGNDGTEFVDGARIEAYVDGTSAANDLPSRLVFSTTADGASFPTKRLVIDSAGDVKVAGDNTSLNADGSATFAGDVIVGSRGRQWMIVESNGLAHLVEQTRSNEISTADLVDAPKAPVEYPPLRDIPGELTMVEEQLQKVLEKLRMVPEAGWEVWDGSD